MAKKAKANSRTTARPPKKQKRTTPILAYKKPKKKTKTVTLELPIDDFPPPPSGVAGVCGFDAFGNKITWAFPGAEKYFKGGPEGVQKWTNT